MTELYTSRSQRSGEKQIDLGPDGELDQANIGPLPRR
jgi:hypothetical protein